ncbi:indole-3-acetate beta-glucosyltransferase [Zea mays]|uniref:Glycosyltransferase n=1 Tax=Zea mays TaxID=4577 RepID=C4JBU1_MAIZE|nr:indole-3-acetate beta-glucosyltransferase [Zea mays]ACR38641.1 unknown [Zea mays]ONM56404.1 UDP-glycosyltransferase 74B1 [Zea mays]
MARPSDQSVHVLLLPFPTQGHINPLLQFGKRLAGRAGVRCTLAATRFVVSSTKPTPSSVHVAVISDGCDEGGPAEVGGMGARYFERLESAGSETLDELLRSESALGRPVHVVVYDAFAPWAQRVARRRGAACAAFLTQTCAVDIVYAHAWAGRVPVPPLPLRPEEARGLALAGLSTQLEVDDMPTFLGDTRFPPCFRELLMNQFLGLDTADHVLVNSFYDLEPQEADYLASTWRAKMVGPTVPSAFLDNRLPDDVSYGIHLHAPMAAESKAWLDAQQAGSVLYVSFGSMASLSPEQMGEIAEGLYGSGKPFLWVVRATEAAKVPKGFADRAQATRGLLVSWCPQLEVLAHPAVGCFFTHCGWNSTVEALSAGVPMVAMPDWSDQTTNAKYIQDVWRVGVRVRPDGRGVVRSEEVERCVRDVMEGEMGEEFRARASHWSSKARKAMGEGGSSDVAISNFLSCFGHSAHVTAAN